MKYTLNFSLKLERHDSCIVYNPKEFVGKPILISVPDIVELVEHFIETFEAVGITEQTKTKPILNEEKPKEANLTSQEQLPDSTPVTKSTALTGVSAKAYICKSKELKEAVLDQFCADLTKYFQECCSQIYPENFLSEEINLYISGLREVLELRNYLAQFTRSKKKSYQDGYLYIAVV